jgi:glycolate oxidase
MPFDRAASPVKEWRKRRKERSVDRRIKEALCQIVGPSNFTEALIDRVSYSYDASDHTHRPEAAVWPTTKEQISQILGLANEERLPIVPRGAGTGLAGSVVPIRGGLVLDLSRMNRILEIRIPDRLVIVEPGVVYADLERALAPHGFFFPPDPASGSVCTLGGNVATNAGGIRGAKYGVTRDYVKALEVVLADGRILRCGSGCMKSASGYDLCRLFVGSEGTLGVITEITLKISPKPLSFKTALASFSTLNEAGEAVAEITRSGIIPSVLEILDEHAITVLRTGASMRLPAARAMILVETDGWTEEETSFQMDRIMKIFRGKNVTSVQLARTSQEAEALWRGRKSIGSLAAQLRTNNVSEDVTVPMSKVPDLLASISAIVSRQGLPFVIFGHAGDGNLHPRIMYERSDPDQVKALRRAVQEIFELTCSLGGTLSGEHGIGLAKARYMRLEHEAQALEMMRRVKELFDPHHILNPGKMALETEAMSPERSLPE